MVTKLRLVFSITIVFFSFYASGQSKYWEKLSSQNNAGRLALKDFKVQNGQVFNFQEKLFREELRNSTTSKGRKQVVHFPNSKGEIVSYVVEETSVFSKALSEKYPEIKSYRGHALQNPSQKIRFSTSHKDVQAMIVNSSEGHNSYIQKSSNNKYVIYKRTSKNAEDFDFICRTQDKILQSGANLTAKPVDDQLLRKYRIAISTTAEYTQHHGGTKADALAAINATLTRVNQVFETDLAVTLELVPTNDRVVFTNPSTDPYSGSLSALGNQAQRTFDDEIGVSNYDLGHVLHKGENGGNAGFIGGICTNGQKGSAYSSGQQPEGDVFDLDFVAHEIGHQLGANHTWSYELEGTLVQVEPGSGSTIMGYAGITENDNVAPNGDDYLHYVSIEQITETLRTKSCGEAFSLVNEPPVVQPVEDYIIPKSTAFVLTGSATDSDAEDVLTYTWEQIDNGVVTSATFGPTNPSGANFRSRPPNLSGTRYFPQLSRVLNGNLIQENPTQGAAWETVSDVERELNFALTVRDNAEGGGQVVSELVNILVTNNSGPFAVTSQTTSSNLVAGEVEMVEWDVSNTDIAPISTEFVDILLSNDGGQTFSTVLASGVANDGSHSIIVPAIPTSEARIMVRPVDNIYYAVNAVDFSIEVSEIVMNFESLEYEVCQFNDLTVPFAYETYLGFSEEVVFSVEDLPENLTVTIEPDTVITGGVDVELLFENTENVLEGSYPIRVLATSNSVVKEVPLVINIYDNNFTPIQATAPENGTDHASVKTQLQWEGDASYTSYEVQIATNSSFSNIVEVATVTSNFFTPTDLQNQTTYYWRVRPLNTCGAGSFSAANSFTTVQVSCESKEAVNLPLEISAVGTPQIRSSISFFEDLPVSDLNVNLNIEHSFTADLVVRLISPQGTTVTLLSNSCGDLQNIEATFDDDGDPIICGLDGANAISGTVQPLGTLSSFNGESVYGEWILEVADNASSDGGGLIDFSLDICVEGQFRPDADDGDDLCLGTPEGAEVNTSGCQIFRFPTDNFTVSVESESCRNNDDGKITIEPKLKLDYTISLSGNGIDINDEFTTSYLAENLSSGSYQVCIVGSATDMVYEEYCFEVFVSQPEALGVTAVIVENGSQLSLNMSGSQLYTIELNGNIIKTDKSTMLLDLSSGKNLLTVSTDNTCQGVFQDTFVLNERTMVFPNPFKESTKVWLGSVEREVSISIFASNGQLVLQKQHVVNGNKEVDLNFTGLPRGMYVIRLDGEGVSESVKVIKQ